MFITAPGLVQHLHPSQVAPRQAHWPAITLAIERPWYLLVHRVACGGGTLSQTTLVAWDTTLMALLAIIPAVDVTGVARLHRCTDEGPGWALQGVSALWTSAPCEAPAVGPMLFQLGTDPQLRSTDMQPVGDAPGRRLLFQAPAVPVSCGGLVGPASIARRP